VVELGAIRAARVAIGPQAMRGLVQVKSLRRQLERIAKPLDRLPDRKKLELEVAKKAVALGVSVLQLAVAPNVLRVAQTAVRALELVRSVSRDADRDLGRER
jgi:hypothetical protein